jgi:membrane-bound metal-dependent hydrolase YbcI (DUF457 family)
MGAALGLILIPTVNNQIIFFAVIMIASLFPDIDIAGSHAGRKWYFKPVQWFVKHRGIIHSFTLCVAMSFVIAYFVPVLALPFFLGYSVHLFADSLTKDGIRPFWPFKKEVAGSFPTGGKVEEVFFAVFVIIDIILLIKFFV